MQCTDVDDAEALLRFIDGLQGNIQAWVRTQKPADLQLAMQKAEQISSIFATASQNDKRGSQQAVAVPFAVR